MAHSYEEIRGVVLDILAGREKVAYDPNQYAHIEIGVAEVLFRREVGQHKALEEMRSGRKSAFSTGSLVYRGTYV